MTIKWFCVSLMYYLAAEYRVCHPQCVPSGGCSGPNTTHCVQCVGYRDTTSHQCVSTCSEIQ